MTMTSNFFGALSNESEGLCTDPNINLDVYIDDARGSSAGASAQAIPGATAAIIAVKKAKPIRLIDFIHFFARRYNYGAQLRAWLAGTGSSDPWATPTAEQVYSIDELYLGGGSALRHSQVYRGARFIRATPATGLATAALDAVLPAQLIDELGAPAPGVGHRLQLLFTVAAPGWTVNDFGPRLQGLFVRITRAGVKRWPLIPIADNAADSITLDLENVQAAAMLADLLATDTVEIVRPSSVVQGATVIGATRLLQLTGHGVSLMPNLPGVPLVTGDQGHALEGFELRNVVSEVAGLSLDRCRLTGTGPANFYGATQLVNCADAGQGINYMGEAQGGQGAPTSRPDSATDPTPANAACAVELMCRRLTIGEAGRRGSYLQRAPLSAYGSAAAGIELQGRGSEYRQDVDTYLGGDANTTCGMRARFGALGRVAAGSGAGTHRVIVGGAALGLIVGVHGGIAWGAAATQFEDAAQWNGNYNASLYTPATPVAVGDDSRIMVG